MGNIFDSENMIPTPEELNKLDKKKIEILDKENIQEFAIESSIESSIDQPLIDKPVCGYLYILNYTKIYSFVFYSDGTNYREYVSCCHVFTENDLNKKLKNKDKKPIPINKLNKYLSNKLIDLERNRMIYKIDEFKNFMFYIYDDLTKLYDINTGESKYNTIKNNELLKNIINKINSVKKIYHIELIYEK